MATPQVRFYHDHVLVKEGGTRQRTPWHQDQPYYNVDGRGVSAWIPVDPVPEDGCLELVAGTHRGPWLMPRTFLKKEARWTFDQQRKLVARKAIEARWAWAWACDDPRSLERFGLEVRQSATITRPPRAMRAQLPFGYRYLVPLADPFLGKAMDLTLFRASSPAAGGHAATTPDDGPA